MISGEQYFELEFDEKAMYLTTELINNDIEPVKLCDKIVHITHNDLDGIGCIVVGKMLGIYGHRYEPIHVISTVNEVDMNVINHIIQLNETTGNLEFVKRLIISDISVKDKMISDLLELYNAVGEVILIDHHQTAEWLNEYSWAHVTSGGDSATYLLADYFWKNNLSQFIPNSMERPDEIFEYARIVSRYDTWEWKNNPIDYSEENHNILLNVIGVPGYIDFVTRELFTRGDFKILKNDSNAIVSAILNKRNDDIDKSTKHVLRNISRFMFGRYRAAVIKYESPGDLSIVANNVIKLSNNDPEGGIQVLFILCGDNTLSLRKGDCDINLGELATILAFDPKYGGGHPDAAGCKLDYEAFIGFLRLYYKKSESYNILYKLVTPNHTTNMLGVIKLNDNTALLQC